MLIGIFYSQIVESSSLVAILFREALSHPYISFFHLLVNGFPVIIILIIINIFYRRFFSECAEAVTTSLIPLVTNFSEICAFIIDFSFTVWTKKSAKKVRKHVTQCLQKFLSIGRYSHEVHAFATLITYQSI